MKLLLLLLLPVSLFAQTAKNDNTGSAKTFAFVNSIK